MPGPATISLPPFRGAVRRLILANVVLFFLLAILSRVAASGALLLTDALLLSPGALVRHFGVWRLLTYPFLNFGIMGTAFALLTLWFAGSMLEDSRGSRWFLELFFTSAIGGGVIACLLALLPLPIAFGFSAVSSAAGITAPLFGVLVAFGVMFGEMEFLLFFLVRMKAKYMVILGVLVYLATLFYARESFDALLALACGLAGYLFVRAAGRQGIAFRASEGLYGVRNQYYRWKRRRAARKFEVYMRKQNRVVKFDEDGRYIDPDEERRNPNSRKWMN